MGEIYGRETELDRVSAVSGHALVLSGEPGIGKTTLWEAGIAAARERGVRVLVARPSGAETELSFAGLIDLCEGLEVDMLPEPQRDALEVALLRQSPVGVPPEPHAIGLGLRNALAAGAPALVAIDDLQWLDDPSAEALALAARRLDDARVGFLLARRPGEPSAVEPALERRSLERLAVGSLSSWAIRELLRETPADVHGRRRHDRRPPRRSDGHDLRSQARRDPHPAVRDGVRPRLGQSRGRIPHCQRQAGRPQGRRDLQHHARPAAGETPGPR
jgi:hypothetical protein